MHYAVVKLCELCFVPSVGSSYEIARDALQTVNVRAAALRTGVHHLLCILVAAVHAAVARMVNAAVANVVLVHHIHDTHNGFGVVCGIAVNLYIEDVSAACEWMVG